MFNCQLEDVAIELRNALNIDPGIIINPKHLNELCEKVEENIKDIKIKRREYGPKVSLDNEKWTICICGNTDELFYSLCEMLSFVILFDKKTLNAYELEHSEFRFPRMKMDYDVEYLKLAFMMPRRAFMKALIPYSSGDGSTVNMFKMQDEVNKYCYKRGIDLNIWK